MEAKSAVTVSSHNYFMITTVGGQDINRSNRVARPSDLEKSWTHPGWALGLGGIDVFYIYAYVLC